MARDPSSPGWGSRGRWPRPLRTTSTGTRLPSWCGVAARHSSRSRSSAEAAPMAMEMLHVYAELAAAGDPVQERYPGIAAHLRACGPCGEDFDGLLAALRDEAT